MQTVPGNTLTVTGSYRRAATVRPLADIDVIRMVRVDAVRHLVRARLEAELELGRLDAALQDYFVRDQIAGQPLGKDEELSWHQALTLAIGRLRANPPENLSQERLDTVSARAFATLLSEFRREEETKVIEEIKEKVSTIRPTNEETSEILLDWARRCTSFLLRRVGLLRLIGLIERLLVAAGSARPGLQRLREFVSTHRSFFLNHGAHPPRINSLVICSLPVAPLA